MIKIIIIFVCLTEIIQVNAVTFGEGIMNPVEFLLSADYTCISRNVKTIQRKNYIISAGDKCNQVRVLNRIFKLNMTMEVLELGVYRNVDLVVEGKLFVDDFGGLRTEIFDGRVLPALEVCTNDRVVFYHKLQPCNGDCEHGISQLKSISAFAFLDGLACKAYCTGKAVMYVTNPYGYH